MLRYRRHFVGRPFPFAWAGFAALASAAMLGLWALHCVLQLGLFDLRTAMVRGALTVALFPAASLLLGRSQRALIGAPHDAFAPGPPPCLATQSARRC